MISDKVFNTTGTQKIFGSDFKIISEDHLRVFLDGVVVPRDSYDLINNAAVFNIAPLTGQVITLQVGTTPADILESPTTAGIVAANIDDIILVASQLAALSSISDIADVTSLKEDTAAIYATFKDDYAGHGTTLPATENDGTLFYYSGLDFYNGLYIYYTSNLVAATGKWRVIGRGPQGPQGPEGIQGPIGLQGIQGETGTQGIQGQQGIQGALGNTGLTGVTGATGPTGPTGAQGVVGPKGDLGPQGLQGNQGPLGLTGSQGPIGNTGQTGDSFQIDKTGTLAERDLYDLEVAEFAYYATDYSVVASATPDQDRFVGNGVETNYTLSFIPDGPQSIVVVLGGVIQGVDTYTVNIVEGPPEVYTVSFLVAPEDATNIIVREFSIATGYGALFRKLSATSADWSAPVPFGRGPRGDQGPQGIVGIQGPTGDQGLIGVTGATGLQGATGIQGPQGATGDLGPQGPAGDVGLRGPTGIQGPEGAKGTTGDQGLIGVTGATGPQGPQGPIGDQGLIGLQGARGEDGLDGTDGVNGTDGADGRSSSGLVKWFDIAYSNSAPAPTAVLGTFNVTSVKSFRRMVKVTQLRGYSADTRTAAATLTFVSSLGGDPIKGTGGLTTLTPLFPELPVVNLIIPAGHSGTITIGVEGSNAYAAWNFSVSAAGKFITYGGNVLIEVFPEPTDIT